MFGTRGEDPRINPPIIAEIDEEEHLCQDTREAYARLDKAKVSKPIRDWRYMSKILDSVLDVWVKRPEMSLGQMLEAAVSEAHKLNLYDISDDRIVTLLKDL